MNLADGDFIDNLMAYGKTEDIEKFLADIASEEADREMIGDDVDFGLKDIGAK